VSTRIVVDTASDERLRRFVELSATYYSTDAAIDPTVVAWRHLQAPTGPSTTVELVDGDETVGRMWIQTHEWSVRGVPVTAANPIDFLIREDHRRLPAFMSLFKSTMAEAQRRADLVFHTSNPLTDDLYRKLMKLTPVTELDGAVVAVRPFATAEAAGVFRAGVFGRALDSVCAAALRIIAKAAGISGVRLSSAPSRDQQDRVASSLAMDEAVCATRSGEYREWRFRGAGSIRYDVHWVTRRGKTLGYVVTTDRDIDGVRGRFVVDLVMPGSPSRLTIVLMWLRLAGIAAGQRRHALFFFYNRKNPRLARLAGLPLVTVSRDRLPQRVPVFVRPSRSAEQTAFDGVDWSAGYFVLSDFDMF
jgi:hypothetical protein